jgi:poly(3-hydroxybutyrate) depolymerase
VERRLAGAGGSAPRRAAAGGDAPPMIYPFLQAHHDLLLPIRGVARALGGPLRRWSDNHPAVEWPLRRVGAAMELLARLRTTHERPAYGLSPVRMGNRVVEVREEVVFATPFGALLRFRKDGDLEQPRLLVVAPMSGHFATLLRGTLEALLPDHDLHITDWANARDVPVSAGSFGADEFLDHVIRFLEAMGPGGHVLAVCQPAPATLAAVALMAEARHPATPRSATLMAGPIDTRVNPTRVNELAKSRPIGWFERHLIGTVPRGHGGAGRRVYPGAVQLAAFMSMNLERHIQAHRTYLENLVRGDWEAAAAHERFYEEYFAVMDLPAEYYLGTVRSVFQEHSLPAGRLAWRGRRVRLEAIRRTALLVVEGEEDDICSVGQTMAALDLCRGLPMNLKRYHLQTGVGHYGVFNGKRWAFEIYPRVRDMIQAQA